MGLCESKAADPAEQQARDAEKSKSKAIDRTIGADKSIDQSKNKLLLLGAGESGKSTLFKQMVSIYGKGYSDSDMKEVTALVYSNILGTVKVLVDFVATNPTLFEGELKEPDSVAFISGLKADNIDEEVGRHLKAVWADPVVQSAYVQRNSLPDMPHLFLADSIGYFMQERIDDICSETYVPSKQDHLRIRVRTTGINKTEYEIDGNSFEMFDVGGQRSERKKWINCFDNVTAVLFVAAISEFDQVLFEEKTQNRIEEALALFGDIANCDYFERTAMILFLNKRDIFQEKIERGVMMNSTFPEFQGTNNVQECSEFLVDKFAAQNQNPDKDVYTHITCATDSENVFTVFSAVKDIIIKRGLMRAGLV